MAELPSGPAILVGVDGSTTAGTALRWAIRLAGLERGTVTAVVVRIGKLPAVQDEDLAHLNAEVDCALAENGGTHPVTVTTAALSGDPARELIRLSAAADMLVIGGQDAAHAIGRVTAGALRRTQCPVVIVPVAEQRHWPE